MAILDFTIGDFRAGKKQCGFSSNDDESPDTKLFEVCP